MSAAQTAGVAAPARRSADSGRPLAFARAAASPPCARCVAAPAPGASVPARTIVGASVVIAGASRADDARESESGCARADPTPALEFGRSAKRASSASPCSPRPPSPPASSPARGQVAVVAAAAMFGGAGVAQAAAIRERGAAGQIPLNHLRRSARRRRHRRLPTI